MEVFAVEEEWFITENISTGHDPYLYYQRADNIFNHLVVFGSKHVYMETIKPDTMQCNEDDLLKY